MAQVLAGRYELGRTLGSGGMAKVLEAQDRVLDRAVAVKLMREEADAVARERFVREARAAARFHHPNAVAVYDTGEDDEQPWIAMELVRGGSLADRLADGGALAPDEAVEVAAGVLSALAAAHRQGMVHRDLKPANILLPEDGGVKLADFGIAKGLQDATLGLTATGMLVGTATYVAPELVHGQPATAASDVYSFGVVLYEMLAGAPPFTGETAIAVAYAHTATPVPPLAGRCDAPTWLVAVVERALAKHPDDRYPDAGAMSAALRGRTEVPATAAAGAAAAAAPSAVSQRPSRPPPTRVTPATSADDVRRGMRGRRVLMWLVGLTIAALVVVALLSAADELFGGVPAPEVTPPAATEPGEPEPEPEDEPEPEPTTDEPSPSPTTSPTESPNPTEDGTITIDPDVDGE